MLQRPQNCRTSCAKSTRPLAPMKFADTEIWCAPYDNINDKTSITSKTNNTNTNTTNNKTNNKPQKRDLARAVGRRRGGGPVNAAASILLLL